MDAVEAKYNIRNPAVKRILRELKEIQNETTDELIAEALEENLFEWHFVLRGPPDTDFQGGLYHGRILLPPEYPFKPPSIMLLTPSGRFETGVKICLSITQHHPDHWQPAWGVRTALTALQSFFPTEGGGAIGSLEFPSEERRRLAARSREQTPQFGDAERQRVTDALHRRMLDSEGASSSQGQAERQPALGVATVPVLDPQAPPTFVPECPNSTSAPALSLMPGHAPEGITFSAASGDAPQTNMGPRLVSAGPLRHSWEDTALTWLAGLLIAGIAAILLKKAAALSHLWPGPL